MSKSKENSDADDEDKMPVEDEEDEVFEDDDIDSVSVCSSSLKLDQDGAGIGSASRSSSIAETDKYQFDLRPHHVVKSRIGRKVFKCDICMAVYRHAFSLKRHYIRNHINYTYVTKGDLQNCQITSEALETLAMAMALQKKQKDQVELVKQAASLEETNNSSSKEDTTSQTECDKANTECDVLSNENQHSQNSDLLLSPGKDENRNKIIDGAENSVSDKNKEVSNSTIEAPSVNNLQEQESPDNKSISDVSEDVSDKCEGKVDEEKRSHELDTSDHSSSKTDTNELVTEAESNSEDKQKSTDTNNASISRDKCENERDAEIEHVEQSSTPQKEENNRIISEQSDKEIGKVEKEQCQEDFDGNCKKTTESEAASDITNEEGMYSFVHQ